MALQITEHKVRQSNMWSLILPPSPPTGGLTPFNAYIALLQSSGHDTIWLLQDFDEILFQQPPCNILEAEDERLEKQNEVTCTRWEKFQCSMDSEEGI